MSISCPRGCLIASEEYVKVFVRFTDMKMFSLKYLYQEKNLSRTNSNIRSLVGKVNPFSKQKSS